MAFSRLYRASGATLKVYVCVWGGGGGGGGAE